MSTALSSSAACRFRPDLVAPAIDSALARIAPLWPLRHFVAVNPFLGWVHRPFAEACAHLQRIAGAAPLLSPADYQKAYSDGLITPADLADAGDEDWTPEKLRQALNRAHLARPAGMLLTVADLLDQRHPRAHWSTFVAEEISKWCSVAFDENQTTWSYPWKTQGLYAGWREAAAEDRNPEAFGLVGFRSFVAALPGDASDAIRCCLARLDPQCDSLADFLHRQLATIPGWAGHAQYRVREDALRGQSNPLLRDLLAIRLAYDAALYEAFARDGVFRADWRHQSAAPARTEYLETLQRWQRAYEAGYQRKLAHALAGQSLPPPAARPLTQAVFCIDVRSEIMRRHLESTLPGVQTIGFAGFFGFPVAHRPAAAAAPTARCPVLLVPPVNTAENRSAEETARATADQTEAAAWKAFQNSAASCFTFVETAGLAFGGALAGKPRRPRCDRPAPRFEQLPVETRADLAAGALRNMSLTRNFARLVLLCGHGSQSANNPYASGLDCGACGGHAGDVNARLAAATLNDPAVRARLAAQGIAIPTDTCFVAGLHNTTTDDIVLFDLEQLPASHDADLAVLRQALALAGAATRRERAPRLGIRATDDAAIAAAVRRRAEDISEVRPEWGLANNAAFVAAPRHRTARLNLEGRVFLHDYDATADQGDKVLTLILCAPVVVASWINLQYYASRVDPVRYGAGNKVLHNVLGGLGATEGNAGDLKVGLPLQSIHDGRQFTHEPRRLSVFIEAAPERIADVLHQHAAVRQLFDHEWLHLFSLQGDTCLRYREGRWEKI
ncbi:YbcC family protein [Oleiharenicola sp. Vm1]|uniref:YbcC family protein n=1 Tax=Oleiharenicola sp. Vm1 TaxID=3398393 RepID=UPI0039F585CB